MKEYTNLKHLSNRLIAMNASRNGNKGQISSYLFDYYKELTRQPWLSQLVGQIRDLTAQQQKMQEAAKAGEPQYEQIGKQIEGLKKQLPFRSPHYFHFFDDHRAQKSIDPESFTFQTTVDIDHLDEVEEAVKRALLLNGMFFSEEEMKHRSQEFSDADLRLWQGKVLHIERSARGKAHIDIRIPVGMTIAEAQAAFCKLIHATEDESCITPERIIFITDAASEIYVADNWYKRLSENEIAEYREAYRQRGLDIDGRALASSSSSSKGQFVKGSPTVSSEPITGGVGNGTGNSAEDGTENSAGNGTGTANQYEQTYEGVPYEAIVKALVEVMGGAPAHGSRNNFIFREACLLRYICNSDAEWIKQVIDIFGEDENKAFATVESACKVNQTAVVPELVKHAIEIARKRFLAQQATEDSGIYAPVPPQLPARLPKLMKLLTSKVPDDFKPAVAMAVFPALAAHLKGVNFRYIDNQVHEAAIMNLLIAPMSSGKSLVNGPIDCIVEDMALQDKISREKEQEWKDEVNCMGDNKKKPVRPEGLYIRIVSPDLTRAAYIQRLDDVQKAGDAYLYCKMDEVDMLRKFNDPSQLIRLCWDNSEDGQERVGTKSVTARVKTRFNWNASSTIAVTQKFFSVREVADGAVSRLSLATIIRPDFAPRPEVGSYDAQFKSQLSPYIQQLNAASGFKECRKARQLIERLENEIMEMAQLAYNKPYAEFAKRGLANGFRRAMVLYLANGEKWEKAIEDFIVWSVKYDLWCKMRFFGNQMQEAIDADSRSVCHTPGVSNLLLYVHDTFDKTEIQNICQVHGTKTKLAILLCNWKKRGFIMKNEDGTFTKTARFIAKYGHYGTPGVAA